MTLSTHTPAGGSNQQFADTPADPGPVQQQASQTSAALPQADGAADAHSHKPIEEALAAHHGKVSHAALQLRASRGTLYRRLKHWRDIEPE